MSEPIIIDANIIKDVARGNKMVADALLRYSQRGIPVYIARAAFDELVTRAPTVQLGGSYREILSDMRIQIAPSGATADRVNFYADNIQHVPLPGKPGQIREYDRKNDPTKPGDVFVAAQAKALNGRLWTLDDKLAKRARAMGVSLAAECALPGTGDPHEEPARARQLLGLNPKVIGADGKVVATVGPGGGTAGSYSITSGRSSTAANEETTGRAGTTAYVGVPDTELPETGGPSARGEAIIGGIQIAFEGVNFILNLINDHVQKQRVTQALDKVRPAIAQERAKNPRLGILILFFYTQVEADPDSLIKPGAAFHYLGWGKGATRDEALEDYYSTPSISIGTGPREKRFSQEIWIPPIQKTELLTARCPFPPVAEGSFNLTRSHKAMFQLVEFDVLGGFDDIVERSVELPAGTNARFAVLKAPSEVSWLNINGAQKVKVPLKTMKTANGRDITVVDLDPWSPFHAAAAMCFPIDDWTKEVFECVSDTSGAEILHYINFSMIRWIRAQNINLLKPI